MTVAVRSWLHGNIDVHWQRIEKYDQSVRHVFVVPSLFNKQRRRNRKMARQL
jgi:hypothetical protein